MELAWPDIEPSYEWTREAALAEYEEPPAVMPVSAPPGRFPTMDRDELEAAIWHALSGVPGPETVDAILNAADAYATREAMLTIEAL